MSTSRLTRRVLFALGLLAALAFASVALAQTSAGYNLSWNRVGSGGRSTSAGYIVTGCVGQPVAGPPQAASASYGVTGGFWYPDEPTPPPPPAMYLPLVTK